MQTELNDSYHTLHEIVGQPEAWAAVLKEVPRQASAIHDWFRSERGQEVLFTGCGSTFFVARTVAAVFQGVVGSCARAYPASDLVLFPDAVLNVAVPRKLVAISKSGRTAETLAAIDEYQARYRHPAMGITCYDDAPLVQKTAIALIAREAQDRSIAHTRSIASMLVAAQLLAIILSDQPLSDGLLGLPDRGTALIDQNHRLAEELGADSSCDHFVFLGSGPFYGLACEGMLKMKEMSQSHAEAFHFLEIRHGPMCMVSSATLVVGLLSETAWYQEARVLAEMRTLGAKVLAISPKPLDAESADYQVALPDGLTDFERGALYLPVLQLMAYYRSLHNGLNPDQPSNHPGVITLELDEG